MVKESWDEILGILCNSARFPYIPEDLIKYIRKLLREGSQNRFIEALRDNTERPMDAVNSMFKTASEITGHRSDELLKRTDFNYRDMDPSRIESAFAEIRSINWLHTEGFVGIKPLSARSKRTADIIAKRRNNYYAIEVVNSIYDARDRFTPEELKDWLLGRLLGDKKSVQLDTTAAELKNARRVFIGIVDTNEPVIFQTHEGFFTAAKLAWKAAGGDPKLHICFVTGRQAVGYGRDDSVFPDWE